MEDFIDTLNLLNKLDPLLEVEQDGVTIHSMGKAPFQEPVHITFTMEKQDYQKFLSACNLASKHPYEALAFLCKKANQFLPQHKKRKKHK